MPGSRRDRGGVRPVSFRPVRARGLPIASILVTMACQGAEPAPAAPSRAPLPRWERLDAARRWPIVAPRAESHGHGVEPWFLEVRASPGADAAYRALAPGATMPEGATLAAFHTRGAGAPGSIFAMTKLHGGTWEYLVTDADGVIAERGSLAACQRCHREARADGVFGPSTRP